MKTPNYFKGFIAFRLAENLGEVLADRIDELNITPFMQKLREGFEVTDPTAGDWRRIGLCDIAQNTITVSRSSSSATLCVQFNERILPSKVRDEHVNKRVAELTELQGRKPGKKEFAEIRETVVESLLPQAFIKRSRVLVSFVGDLLIIWTTSFKKADEIISLLAGVTNTILGTELRCARLRTKTAVDAALRMAVLTVDPSDFEFDGSMLKPASSCVLRATESDDKRKARFKAVDIDGSDEIHTMLTEGGFTVSELGLVIGRDGEEKLNFTVSENFAVKGFSTMDFADANDDGDAEEVLFATIWLAEKEAANTVEFLLQCFGGEVVTEKPAEVEEAGAVAEDDGDEL